MSGRGSGDVDVVDLARPDAKTKVLFICLGNICRSPIAEAVFAHLVKTKKLTDHFETDSAATASYHVGDGPDPRAMKVLEQKGIKYNHVVRQITTEDFQKYDYIFGMDNNNIETLKRMTPRSSKAKIGLLGEHDPNKELIIRDPYYDNDEKGFYKCYDQCRRSCIAFLESFGHKL